MGQAGQRLKTGLGVGLAFLVGIGVFVVTLAVVQRLNGTTRAAALVPPAKRAAPATLAFAKLPAAGEPSKQWRLDDQRGRIVVVNYFATWCPPCVAEMPEFVKLAADYAPKGVSVAAVSLDDAGAPGERESLLHAFARDKGMAFPILLPGAESPLFGNGTPIPQTFFYDRQGRRALQVTGQMDGPELRATVDQLLNEPA